MISDQQHVLLLNLLKILLFLVPFSLLFNSYTFSSSFCFSPFIFTSNILFTSYIKAYFTLILSFEEVSIKGILYIFANFYPYSELTFLSVSKSTLFPIKISYIPLLQFFFISFIQYLYHIIYLINIL